MKASSFCCLINAMTMAVIGVKRQQKVMGNKNLPRLLLGKAMFRVMNQKQNQTSPLDEDETPGQLSYQTR